MRISDSFVIRYFAWTKAAVDDIGIILEQDIMEFFSSTTAGDSDYVLEEGIVELSK